MAASLRLGSAQKRPLATRCLLVLMGLLAAKLATQLFVQPAGSYFSNVHHGRTALRQGMQDSTQLATEEEGLAIVDFGKHSGTTYTDMLETELDYCKWVASQVENEDCSESMRRFGDWIKARMPDIQSVQQAEAQPGSDSGVVSFGKHRGKTYEAILLEEPDYCRWLLQQVEESDDVQPATGEFAEWLQQNQEALDDALALKDANLSVGFGKYRGRAYEEVLAEDPDYCRWVMESSEQADASTTLSQFADWLKTQDLSAAPTSDDHIVRFGKHKGKTYEALLDEDLDYCQWILDQDPEEMGRTMKPFYEWLISQAQEAEEEVSEEAE